MGFAKDILDPGDITGGLSGKNAADASREAADVQQQAAKYAADQQMKMFQQVQQNLGPYMNAGTAGLGGLLGMLGLTAPNSAAMGGGMGGASAQPKTYDQLRQELLSQYTTPGTPGQPPDLASLLGNNAAARNFSNAEWGYDPRAQKWGYNLTYQGGGDAGDPYTKWVYGDPAGASAGQVDNTGLEAAIQRQLAAQQSATTGANALGGQGDTTGLGALLTKQFNFDPSQLEQTPGYQFTLNQGLKSLANQNAAKGLGLSGAQQKGALEYATGLADNTYGQQYQRALQSYATNYGLASDQYNRLAGLAGMGQSSAAGVGNAGMQTGSLIGNLMTQGANAQASGLVGAANAQTQGANNIMNLGMGLASLFMSDARMKRDVRLLGVTEGGHNWYEYRYIHRPELFQGVMAQELEITNPDAVHEIDGIKYVDYAKVH
jgi:hypothetical protein